MTAKTIIFDEEARSALRKGIDQIADVVCMTLGPCGYSVGLDSGFGSPFITSDGASIAKDIELKDPFLNSGVAMAQEVARIIKEKAGDGTTTGIVLLRALVQAGTKYVAAGINPTALKKGMEKALDAVVKNLDDQAINVKSQKETKNIATVSAGSNAEIGGWIATAFEKVGKTGVIAIEEGQATETTLEIVHGMQIDQGYISAHFCTNVEKMLAELDDAAVLITDKKIQSAQEILPLLQRAASTGKPLLIIADDIDGDALSTLVINKLRGSLKVCAIKTPGFGDVRKELLEDIAVLTGGQVVSEDKGMNLKDADLDVLGYADRIVAGKDKTTIVGGKGAKKEIQARVDQIETRLKKADSSYDKDKLQERRAKLLGGVAVLKVGAMTESEMKKKKQAFEDSLNATRSALEEGVATGGGVALLQAAKGACKKVLENKEEEAGAQIVYRACEAPFRQIVRNTGFDPSTMLEEALAKGATFGFNALTEKVEDLLRAGIIDPIKVMKTSLIHAVSMAGVILLTESMIADASDAKS